ncbi:Bifunctional aspartokinase/homoserine dehydrogenase 1 [Buchnera aphidicola (Takecallis arundicolens)]|uniref:bifunctional aspartate kinase/homoserine dehydrogenase I n=1 Tax=Buchnera aphidicola TaxID=9 RepID=UPI003463F04A
MRVLKFGGTSVSNAKKFLDVVKIIKKKFQYEDIAIVLSAPAKITNYLDQINKNITLKNDSNILFKKIKKILHTLISGIKKKYHDFPEQDVIEYIKKKIKKIKNKIKNINYSNKKIEKTFAEIISQGEIFSIKIMKKIFISQNYPVFTINPVKYITANNNYLNANVKILESKNKIQNIKIPKRHIVLMPGFIAGNYKKELVTLGRNGSDYSAAILSTCLNAHTCEIWTDVDGIYTADPRIVPNAKLRNEISYQDAIELSFFGAKVLHPKTILPLSQYNIKCIIKNTFFPERHGTVITTKTMKNTNNIQGITYIDNIILIIIKVNESQYINPITRKIFSILLNRKVRILSTINAPLENKIFFYIIDKKINNIQLILHKELKQELNDDILKIVHVNQKLKMIAIIGTNIQNNNYTKRKVLGVLKHTDLNIMCINNQFSKNAILIATDNENIIENINIIHDRIFHNIKTLEIFIIGIGGVGTSLIQQIEKQQHRLINKKIKFKICGIANSKKMMVHLNGIKLHHWKKEFHEYHENFCIQKLIRYTKDIRIFNPVIVDCTASQDITKNYYDILKNKIHIVTPNKKANTNSLQEYENIRNISVKTNKKFLYETNVSAGLPIIKTLKNLFDSGDKLINFKGILSGSLSFIFGKLEEGLSISEATIMAKKLGFTEPNPKDDLSGIDVARKLLIIAREAGYKLELHDIKIIPILPERLLHLEDEKIFLSQLKDLDTYFENKIKKSKENNKVLRLIGTIEKDGSCQVKLTEINKLDPLYHVRDGENALIIYSEYYQPMPLVLRGYGAGNNVTAAGIFSDLLQILS